MMDDDDYTWDDYYRELEMGDANYIRPDQL